jgi:hypothetical protein
MEASQFYQGTCNGLGTDRELKLEYCETDWVYPTTDEDRGGDYISIIGICGSVTTYTVVRRNHLPDNSRAPPDWNPYLPRVRHFFSPITQIKKREPSSAVIYDKFFFFTVATEDAACRRYLSPAACRGRNPVSGALGAAIGGDPTTPCGRAVRPRPFLVAWLGASHGTAVLVVCFVIADHSIPRPRWLAVF